MRGYRFIYLCEITNIRAESPHIISSERSSKLMSEGMAVRVLPQLQDP